MCAWPTPLTWVVAIKSVVSLRCMPACTDACTSSLRLHFVACLHAPMLACLYACINVLSGCMHTSPVFFSVLVMSSDFPRVGFLACRCPEPLSLGHARNVPACCTYFCVYLAHRLTPLYACMQVCLYVCKLESACLASDKEISFCGQVCGAASV